MLGKDTINWGIRIQMIKTPPKIVKTCKQINIVNERDKNKETTEINKDRINNVCIYNLEKGNILVLNTKIIEGIKDSFTLSIDCTYKLITVKHFPVIVAGVTDIRGKFLYIGLGVLRRKTAEAFKWVLENII